MGGMFFYEVEGHIQKLSSFGRGKKYGLKGHLEYIVYAGTPSTVVVIVVCLFV